MDCGVLESYRTLGLICDDKSFKWHREGDINYISFPIGKSFLTYNHSNLKIRYTGCQLDKKVNSLDTPFSNSSLIQAYIVIAFANG